MPSSTVEDYLKCIHGAQLESPRNWVSTGAIATALGLSPGTVTTMLKSLAESGLVTYEPYVGARLTASGRRQAVHVLRRHRIVELFLVQVLGMNWSEVHRDAEVLEHAVSERLIERMVAMLGEPEVDPHGDPIPTAEGKIPERKSPTLLSCPTGVPLRLARVLDQRAEFLRFLETHGLTLGSEIEVIHRNEEADLVELRPARAQPIRLGFRAAGRILVEPREGC